MNKEELTDFLGVLHFHGYIDHDASKLGDLADMADFTTPPPQTVSAEEILAEEISEMSDEEFNNNANELLKLVKPFTPKRTPKEEADRIGITGIIEAISEVSYAIEALKSRGIDASYEEEVLTILKGM